jgi:hypothetical protein
MMILSIALARKREVRIMMYSMTEEMMKHGRGRSPDVILKEIQGQEEDDE